MRKYKPAPQISRNDTRTGDAFLREWCEHVGSTRKAAAAADLTYYNHLHVWFNDPDRMFSPAIARKVAQAANMPVEALLFRWTMIKDLPFWQFARRRK